MGAGGPGKRIYRTVEANPSMPLLSTGAPRTWEENSFFRGVLTRLLLTASLTSEAASQRGGIERRRARPPTRARMNTSIRMAGPFPHVVLIQDASGQKASATGSKRKA